MTTAWLKELPDTMWVVDATYTIKYSDDSVSVRHHFYGPYDKESTAKKTHTWAKKVALKHVGPVSADTLNSGYLTVEVDVFETHTNWHKSDM